MKSGLRIDNSLSKGGWNPSISGREDWWETKDLFNRIPESFWNWRHQYSGRGKGGQDHGDEDREIIWPFLRGSFRPLIHTTRVWPFSNLCRTWSSFSGETDQSLPLRGFSPSSVLPRWHWNYCLDLGLQLHYIEDQSGKSMEKLSKSRENTHT